MKAGTYGRGDHPMALTISADGRIVPVSKWTATTPVIATHIDSGMVHQAYVNGVRDGYIFGIAGVLIVVWIAKRFL